MAYVKKMASGKWKFQVTKDYKVHSRTFKTKLEGFEWEKNLKAGVDNNGQIIDSSLTVGELLERYRREKTAKKRGAARESKFIDKFQRDELSEVKLSQLSKKHIAAWRDRSLEKVSSLTVNREWAVLFLQRSWC